jgi:hypothetical protein
LNRFPAALVVTVFVAAVLATGCGAANEGASREHQALRDEVAALTQRLDRAEKDRVAMARRLAQLEQAANTPKPAPPPPPPPPPVPKLDPIAADALTTCRRLEKEKALSGCKAYEPKGLAWKGATTTARFLDPKAPEACGAEDVCMIVHFADAKAYDETKAAVKSVEGLPIYFNDERRVVLKVDARISKNALELLTQLLRVKKVSSPSGL